MFQAKISRVVIGASRNDLPHIFRKRSLHIEDAASDSGFHVEIKKGVLKSEVINLFADVKK